MADEILKRDENHVTVLAGITDDSNEEIKMLRVDPVTKALLVTGSSNTPNVYQLLGSSIKAQPVGMQINGITGNSGIPADGVLQFIAVILENDATITGVSWIQNAQGVYTADNYNGIGLYSYSAGTLTLVASTVDDGNIWKAATASFNTKAFSTPYIATAGVYFVGLLYNSSAQTTAPSLAGQANNLFASSVTTVDFTNSAKIRGAVAAQTSLPATQSMSGVTAVTSYPWVGLY